MDCVIVKLKYDTIALDLEGTLISNAVSQFPRPGLYEFLEFCHSRFEQVVVYTAVREELCRKIFELLVAEHVAPPWLSQVPCVRWNLRVKDLNNVPNTTLDRCLLVDDNPDYVAENQRKQWLQIAKFESPYPDTDRELARVTAEIEMRIKV